MSSPLRVFAARRVPTMNASLPVCTHVAVRDGRILGFGDAADMAEFGPAAIDDRFADQVILPGFIDGHGHAVDGLMWRNPYVGFYPRTAPDGTPAAGLTSIAEVADATALYAITLGVATTLKLDHLIGSIDVGKFADFAVLDTDPTEVPPGALKDVRVHATVLGGVAFMS